MSKSKTFWVVTLVICLLALTMVVVAKPSGGEVLHVPRDYSTIQAAVDAAAEGDTVQVNAGIYNENVVVSTSAVRLHATSGVVLDGTGLTGIGILVRGASVASPVSDVEVSGFEVRSFERGIIVQWAVNAGVHHNEVHQNVDKMPPLVLGVAPGRHIPNTTVHGRDARDW